LPSVAVARADDIPCVSIHPAIDHALSAYVPAVARRAGEVIRAMLADRIASARPDRWTGSRLTGGGFPLEVAFCTSDDRFRFTAEPGAVDLGPHRRLDLAIELMSEEPVPGELVRGLKAMQSGAALKYGAFLGCRIGGGKPAFKLYVEVPASGCADAFDAARFMPLEGSVARMIAYAPATQQVELYVRVLSLEPRSLPAVLAPVGAEAHAPMLLELIEQTYGFAIRGRLPGPSIGVSYVAGPSAPEVTLHFYARGLWGSDARIRRGFCGMARAFDWDAHAYLAVTEPIAKRESWQSFHGLFGITLNRSSVNSITIGICPVAP
jgi:hypothetical protein